MRANSYPAPDPPPGLCATLRRKSKILARTPRPKELTPAQPFCTPHTYAHLPLLCPGLVLTSSPQTTKLKQLIQLSTDQLLPGLTTLVPSVSITQPLITCVYLTPVQKCKPHERRAFTSFTSMFPSPGTQPGLLNKQKETFS